MAQVQVATNEISTSMKWVAQTLNGGNNNTGGTKIDRGQKWHLCIHQVQVD